MPTYLPRLPRGDRPLVVLGISDVVVIEGPAVIPVTTHHLSAWGRWVRDVAIPDDAAERVHRLAERYELVWASEWGHNAHTAFAQALDLPTDPWAFLPVQFDKLERIRAYADGLPWAWIDGSVVDLHEPGEVDDGVIVRVDPTRGISGVDLDDLDARIAELASRLRAGER